MAAPFQTYSYFATCANNLEPLLAEELRSMHIHGVRPQRGGVLFTGTIKDAYRVCLWTRLTSRVLFSLGEVPAKNADQLYSSIMEVPWEDHISETGTFVIQTTGTNEKLRNTLFTNVRVKDAIADRFTEKFGFRPSINPSSPDVVVNVFVHGATAKIAIDLAGLPLHRREYRQEGTQVAAPLKETLAAAMLMVAGWPEIAKKGGSFIDFMCGSGTLAIEAALMAGDVAPGIFRKHWGFLRWKGHDPKAWEALLEEAERRREQGRENIPPIHASDNDARAVDIARRSIRKARLESAVTVQTFDMAKAPASWATETPGLIAVNPAYGERLSTTDELVKMYEAIASVAREKFADYTLAVITPDERVSSGLQLNPIKTADLFNGRILTPVRVYKVGEPVEVAAPNRAYATEQKYTEAFEGRGEKVLKQTYDLDTSEFENRLIKMKTHFEKWARKSSIDCYRVYDADLPDYNCAIDVYHGTGFSEGRVWVQVAEYAAPAFVDPDLAEQRLNSVKEICKKVFEVEDTDVFVKQRKRQKGSDQYEKEETSGVVGIVQESGLLFEVDLGGYVDTGIFLDHRDVRAYVESIVADKRFLNLFAYTGTLTVYAARGKARTTTTIDMSKTYLARAKRNLERNNLSTTEDLFIQDDVLAWLGDAPEKGEAFDVIFCDPPTFSNSKRMDKTFDVVRDHVEMIGSLEKILAPGGAIVFSTNKRGFSVNTEALANLGLRVKDITKQTMPKDFERNPKIHTVLVITRSEQ